MHDSEFLQYSPASDTFKYTCVLTMAKFVKMRETFPLFKTNKHINTKIFVSLPMIFNQWTGLLKTQSYKDPIVTPEYITSMLFKIVTHYREFFSDSDIYMYLGKESYDVPDLYTEIVKHAINELLPTICKFIPRVYFAKCTDAPANTIVGNILMDYVEAFGNDFDEYLQTIFVNARVLDILAASIASGDRVMHSIYKGFSFANKRFLTGDGIFFDWLYHDSKRKPFTDAPFFKSQSIYMLLLLGIIGYPHKSKYEAQPSIRANARRLLQNLIYQNDQTSITEAKHFADSIGNVVAEELDIWKVLTKYHDVLENVKLSWEVDNVDYSIEKLNDTIFKGIPLNLHALYAAQ
jgi:hypothetical protein